MNPGPLIVALDVGTSSVRTLLFDGAAEPRDSFGRQLQWSPLETSDGGVEIDPEALLRLSLDCLSAIHDQMQSAGLRADAVAVDTFWHCFFGVDADGLQATPFLHLFDTRTGAAAEELKRRLDETAMHQRTGCRLHASYWPAKLVWLSENDADGLGKSRWLLSFGEFLFLRLFGAPSVSTSMISASGIWNQQKNRYDKEMLEALPLMESQLAPEEQMDGPLSRLRGDYKKKLPLFDGIPWFPALGDGACNNVGSGCVAPDTFALMVGTSGAMRAVTGAKELEIPAGLWCYRVDSGRRILGGALTNGGDVYAWMRRNLALPDETAIGTELSGREPGAHGLTVLPFFGGERSPYWRADLRATFTGLNLATSPIDILQAAMESVALRFGAIEVLLEGALGVPKKVIGSGGALEHSRPWTQMMADATGHAILPSLEHEATSRGAALLALERLKAIADISAVPARTGPPIDPIDAHKTIYRDMLERQSRLYDRLYSEN